MWPLNMPGPQFLAFYLSISAIVITALALLRHTGEPADAPRVNLSDPYLIAYLREARTRFFAW